MEKRTNSIPSEDTLRTCFTVEIEQKVFERKNLNFSLGKEIDVADYSPSAVVVHDYNNSLIFRMVNKNVLQYYFNLADVPEGVSVLYRSDGFVHLLGSHKGMVLTCIRRPDHHQYGLWILWLHIGR